MKQSRHHFRNAGNSVLAAMAGFAVITALSTSAQTNLGQLMGPFYSHGSGVTQADAYHAEELETIEKKLAVSPLQKPGLQEAGEPTPKRFKFYPMAGIWERDLVVGNWVDLNSSTALLDWNCGAATYDGHDAHDVGTGYFWPWENMDLGWPVFAALDGTVADAHDGEYDRNTSCSGPANYVILDHGNQRTWYFHLKNGSVSVSAGQVVKAGQQIGLVGSSGCSSGPHLHWRTDFNGAVYESFAGGCRTGDSGWVNQLPYNPATYVYEVSPSSGGEMIGGIVKGNRLLGLKYSIVNVPTNSTYRFRYRRPNGTIAADTGAFAINNTTPYRNTWWYYEWWVNLDITDTWHVELLVNNSNIVSAPLTVVDNLAQITNRPPIQPVAVFDPPAPAWSDVVFCKVVSPWPVRDLDYNLVRYRYRWTANGVVIRDVASPALADAIPHGGAPPGSTLTCELTPNDGIVNGVTTTVTGSIAPLSPPVLGMLAIQSGGGVQVAASGELGVPMVIERSENLQNWVPITTNSAGVFTFLDGSAAGQQRLFYRARYQP
jgi:hypothetical protein